MKKDKKIFNCFKDFLSQARCTLRRMPVARLFVRVAQMHAYITQTMLKLSMTSLIKNFLFWKKNPIIKINHSFHSNERLLIIFLLCLFHSIFSHTKEIKIIFTFNSVKWRDTKKWRFLFLLFVCNINGDYVFIKLTNIEKKNWKKRDFGVLFAEHFYSEIVYIEISTRAISHKNDQHQPRCRLYSMEQRTEAEPKKN